MVHGWGVACSNAQKYVKIYWKFNCSLSVQVAPQGEDLKEKLSAVNKAIQ